MKKKSHIALLFCSWLLVSCNSRSEQQDAESEQTQSNVSTTASGNAVASGTTSKPSVEIALHALGDTSGKMKFEQDTIEVPAETPINLTLINEATELTMIHNFVLTTKDKYKEVALAGAEVASPGNYVPDSEHVLTATPMALPGQTVQHNFTSPPAGIYTFMCTYPSHWQEMRGILIAK